MTETTNPTTPETTGEHDQRLDNHEDGLRVAREHLRSHDGQLQTHGQRLDETDRRVTNLGRQVEDEMERRGTQLGTYERALQEFQREDLEAARRQREEDREIERREREQARRVAEEIRQRAHAREDHLDEVEERHTDEDRRHGRVQDGRKKWSVVSVYDAPDGSGRSVFKGETPDLQEALATKAAIVERGASNRPMPWWAWLVIGVTAVAGLLLTVWAVKGMANDGKDGKAEAVKVAAADGNNGGNSAQGLLGALDEAGKVRDKLKALTPAPDCQTPGCLPTCGQAPCLPSVPVPTGCQKKEEVIRGLKCLVITCGANGDPSVICEGEPGICPDCTPPPKKSGRRVIRVPVKGDKGDPGQDGRDGQDAPQPPPADNPPANNDGGQKASFYIGLQRGVLYGGKPYRTAASLDETRQMIADPSTKATGLVCKVGSCRSEGDWRRPEAFAN